MRHSHSITDHKPVDHESLLDNGTQHILQAYGTGQDAAGRDMMVFVIDLHDPSGRAFVERCISRLQIQDGFGLAGGTTPDMKGACSFATPIDAFAKEQPAKELLAIADIPVAVMAMGTIKIFDVSIDQESGAVRRARLLASGAFDPSGGMCELRKA